MSSTDSALTAASSIATMDICKNMRPESSERHLIKAGKFFILLAVFIATLWAPFIDQFPTLWEYLQAVLSYLGPPAVTRFILGLFSKRGTANCAFTALVVGGLTGVLLLINNHLFTIWQPIHYLYSATVIFVVSSFVMVFISFLAKESKLSNIPGSAGKLSNIKVFFITFQDTLVQKLSTL